MAHTKLPHKTSRVHSARYTRRIHASSRKLKLPKDTHTKEHSYQRSLIPKDTHTKGHSYQRTLIPKVTHTNKVKTAPTHPTLPKVQVCIVVTCKNIYKVKNNHNRKKITPAPSHSHREQLWKCTSFNTHTSASARTQSHRLSCLDKEMGFQRRSERLNGVLLLDSLGEDIPEEGSDIPEGSLAVPLCLKLYGIPGPGNIKERCRC